MLKEKNKKILIIIFISIIITFSVLTALFKANTYSNTNSYDLYLHFINIGQGDAILIQKNKDILLIDSGPKEENKKLIKYLRALNVNKINHFVNTHPHEDHIGNSSYIIKHFNVDSIYAPKVTTSSGAFKDFAEALQKKNKKLIVPKVGDTFYLDDTVKVQVLSPRSVYNDNLNNYSIVLKVTYNNNSFLLMGDAEKEVEEELLKENVNVSSDVIKLGHHGSNTSTTEAFLDSVNPKVAVISCGKINEYGHPSKNVVEKLEDRNIQIYRTDILGDIVLKSDGNNISVK